MVNGPSKISGSRSSPISSVQSDHGAAARHVRDVENNPRWYTKIDSPDVMRALERLRRFLASGEPPRTDVPRGYYLNILI